METLHIGNAVIEFQVQGKGEPVLLIPLSAIGDGLGRPLLAQPGLASRYQLIHYHRRGYLGSTLGAEPLTAGKQANDAASLLSHLGVKAAFQDWQLSPQEAAAIRQPVLSILGTVMDNPFMREVRALLHSWFPQTEDYDVPTTHLLQMRDPQGVAQGLAGFFSRHPMS